MNIDWQIPPSIIQWLEVTPDDKPVVLLLRHSVRGDLPPDNSGYTLPITEIGNLLSQQLGEKLGQRLKSLHTSPLLRCVQTANALRTGSGMPIEIIKDNHLGDPGVFVLDDKLAWSNWESLGHEGVMHHLVTSTHALPGMAQPDQAARFLVQQMLEVSGEIFGIHIFVTHDSLVAATAAQLLGEPLDSSEWPWYLEGSFFWCSKGNIHVAYRDSYRVINKDMLNIHRQEKP